MDFFVSRHEVLSIVQTHTLCTVQVDKKQTKQNVLQLRCSQLNHRVTDIFLTERFATALEAEPQAYKHILNTIVR